MREIRTSGSMSGVGKRDLTLYETIDYRVTLRLYLFITNDFQFVMNVFFVINSRRAFAASYAWALCSVTG